MINLTAWIQPRARHIVVPLDNCVYVWILCMFLATGLSTHSLLSTLAVNCMTVRLIQVLNSNKWAVP